MTAFSKVVAGLIVHKPDVMETCETILHELLDDSALDEKRKRVDQERDTVTGQIQALVEWQARKTAVLSIVMRKFISRHSE